MGVGGRELGQALLGLGEFVRSRSALSLTRLVDAGTGGLSSTGTSVKGCLGKRAAFIIMSCKSRHYHYKL